MKVLFLFVAGAVAACAQPFTAGIKLGVPATDFLDTTPSSGINYQTGTNRYLVGPTLELRLPFGLGVEVDALYRHYNFDTSGTIPPAGTTLTTRGSTGAWEFPLLAKYRFRFPFVRPYVDAGVAWDTLTGFGQTVTTVNATVPVPPPANLNQPVHNTVKGFVMGGGFEIRVPFVHLSPEVRYTRWDSRHFAAPVAGFSSNQNQVEIMLGITY